MKFTLSWLKEHLDTQASLTEITDVLTSLGLEVEGVEDPSESFKPFKVAYVEKAEKHPNADKLKVCIVDTGKDKVQVVCGAPNARTGMKGIFAPEGSYIPGTGITLKKGNIRGEDSCGMLVSEREMGLSDDHDGIIELADDAAIGTPFATLYKLDDPVIEIGLTPNRADCAGVRGIARDLAAAGLGTLKPLDDSAVAGSFPSPLSVSIDDGATDACPLFIGRYIKNVKNGPSPDWLQARLKAIGLRPISALVDVTNYLSYALCRPLHVFDADKISGDLNVRLSKEGEKFKALDEEEYTLQDGMTIIEDDNHIAGLAGVMGGLESGCSEDTHNVFLEVAYFDPARTAKTGRALQIDSDARYRFERGIDPAFTVPATEIATRLILELCGGEVSENVVAGAVPDTQITIEFDPAYTAKLTGVDIDASTQKDILETLGFDVAGNGPFKVTRPTWRGDVEGKADLVEEIIRVHGLDNVEAVSLEKPSALTQPAETDRSANVRKSRSALAQRGMQESVTYSFLSSGHADLFAANDYNGPALRLLNPISSEMDQMRPSLLPNLIIAAGQNKDKGMPNVALFEVGPAFRNTKVDGQDIVAAGIRYGAKGTKHWSGTDASRDVDLYDVKADALAVLEAIGAPAANAQVSADAPDYYHPGRSGALRLGKNVLAYFGEIHPQIMQELGVKGRIQAFEVFIENAPQGRKKGAAKKLLEISPLQPLYRDFAFIVDESTKADDIARAAIGTDKKLITNVDIFDVYQGKGVDDGKKSIAINVTLQPTEKTLTDKEIEDLSAKIIDNVNHKTGGVLR